MMLWIIFLLMIGGTVAVLLWPLMRTRATGVERRAVLIAIIAVLTLLPAGAIILYMNLGAPELTGETQAPPAAESKADLAADAADATRAAHNNPGVETYNRLGNILFRMGNYGAAAKAYEQAARLGGAGKDRPGDNPK